MILGTSVTTTRLLVVVMIVKPKNITKSVDVDRIEFGIKDLRFISKIMILPYTRYDLIISFQSL